MFNALQLYRVIAAVSLALFHGGTCQAAVLLSDLDIPLMQGFVELEDSRVVFDTPEGRIIEVRATGPHRAQQVLDYYQVVLPSLSWEQDAGDCGKSTSLCVMAHRDGEILTLKIMEIATTGKKTIIYFSVNPE